MKMIFFMAFFISAFPFHLHAQESSKPSYFTICKNKSDVRTIVVNKTSSGYETVYSKYGQPKVIGSGWSLESNRGFLENVKNNLLKPGYECRDVTEASVQGGTGGE